MINVVLVRVRLLIGEGEHNISVVFGATTWVDVVLLAE